MSDLKSPLSAEQAARVEALKIVLSQRVTPDNAIREADRYAKYIITGKSGEVADKAIPAAAGKAPAEDRTSSGSKVPGKPGKASAPIDEEDGIPDPGGKPSKVLSGPQSARA